MLEKILRGTLPLVALVGIACGSDSSSSPSCAADTDCKGERVCVEGKCEGYGNSGGQSGYDSIGICQRYIDMCPYDTGVIELIRNRQGACQIFCEQRKDMTRALCAWITCAVETGYCDNEVPGDQQIINCIDGHGWVIDPHK